MSKLDWIKLGLIMLIWNISTFYATTGIQAVYLYSKPNIAGLYITAFDMILCENAHACKHEEGHRQDAFCEDNYIMRQSMTTWCSNAEEFQHDVDEFMACSYSVGKQLESHEWLAWYPRNILELMDGFPGIFDDVENVDEWGGYEELYAELYVSLEPEFDNIEQMMSQSKEYCFNTLENINA